MSVVLCFSGGIASGKTSLARGIAERLHVAHASFGAFVRSVAQVRGLGSTREDLQALGDSLIGELGWDVFCSRVLEAAGWTSGTSLLIDGIRHVTALEAIRALVAPTPVKLVFLAVTREVRQARSATRPADDTDLAKADAHSTEQDVGGALRGAANLVLDGTQDPETLIAKVLEAFPLE